MRELIMLISHSAECKGGLIVVSTPSPNGAYRISDSFNFISPQCTLKPGVGDVNHPPPLAMCCPSRLGTLGHPPLDNTNINAYGRLNYGSNKNKIRTPALSSSQDVPFYAAPKRLESPITPDDGSSRPDGFLKDTPRKNNGAC